MTSTDPIKLPDQPSDPALFGPLTLDENKVLNAHLASGWVKQSVVYPVLSEPWQETSGLLDDLHDAWRADFDAQQAARRQAEPEPEASL